MRGESQETDQVVTPRDQGDLVCDATSLKLLDESLQRIDQVSEAGFLEFGRTLEQTYNRACRVADLTGEFIRIRYGDGASGTRGNRTLQQYSDEMSFRFSEMVTALQYQDITRQRIGHVRKALASLVGPLERFGQRSDFSRDRETHRVLGRICRLQHEQLRLAQREFLAAVDSLVENLQGLAACTVIAVNNLTQSAGDDTGSGGVAEYGRPQLALLAEKAGGEAAGLAEDVNRQADSNRAQQDFRQQLAPVLERLLVLGATDEQGLDTKSGETLETLLGSLEQRYTMDSERRVHRKFVGKEAPQRDQAATGDAERTTSRAQDLGDNVELFE